MPSRIEHLLFFQAEDGIRDIGVTGVQTCALPICRVILAGEVEALECGEPPGDSVAGGPFVAVREAVPGDGICGYRPARHLAALPSVRCCGPAVPRRIGP